MSVCYNLNHTVSKDTTKHKHNVRGGTPWNSVMTVAGIRFS